MTTIKNEYLKRIMEDTLSSEVMALRTRLTALEMRDTRVNDLSEISDDIGNQQAGSVSGWNLSEGTLISDDGNAELNSSRPFIRLWASDYMTGTGFWAGRSDGVFKFHLGNPAGNHIQWDGDSLSVAGTIVATAGRIANWVISAGSLHTEDNNAELNSDTPFIRLWATDYLVGTGLWMGKSGGVFKFHLGNPAGNHIKWDGTSLTVAGTILAAAGHILGLLRVGNGDPSIEIDGENKRIRSSNYVAGVSGFSQEAENGNAEFNDVVIRGKMKSAVFEKGEVIATSGTLGVFKSAGKLRTAVITAASPTAFDVDIDDPGTGHAAIFDVDDILRIKDAVVDNWLKVSSISDQANYYRYTCTLQNGDPGEFAAGMAVVDYGQSGDGFLIITADDPHGPFYSVQNHSGSPWIDTHEIMRTGKLAGINDFTETDYGQATMNQAGIRQVWFDNNGRLKAGGGSATLDEKGVSVLGASTGDENAYKVVDSSGNTISSWRSSDNPGVPFVSTYFSNELKTGKSSSITFFANADTGKPAAISLSLRSGTVNKYVDARSDTQLVVLYGLGLYVNSNRNDIDSHFSGVSDYNVLYIDAGNDRVGIGTATPSVKLDVNGAIKATSGYINSDRILTTPRIKSEASSATPEINTNEVDLYRATALAVAITSFTANLSGTPAHGQTLDIEITDNGTARAISWGTSFIGSSNAALPTTTTANKTQYCKFRWDSVDSKWRCMYVTREL